MMQKDRLVSLEKKHAILRVILIVVIVFVLACISILIFNYLADTEEFNIKENFIEIAMKYYKENSNYLPKEVGECSVLTLETLLAQSKIESPEKYLGCNKYESYVKSCKLESGNYHYVPVINCEGLDTKVTYSDWEDGNEKDLSDGDDVRFLFQGYYREENEDVEVLEGWRDEVDIVGYDVLSTVTYYRYRNMEWRWQEIKPGYYTDNDVNENILAYYTTSPDNDYLNSDSETTVYKWYTQRQEITNSHKTYVCKDELGNLLSSETACEIRTDNYNQNHKTYETCGLLNPNSIDVTDKYIEVGEGTICDSKVIKTYYPSGSSDASGEKVYYKEAPVDNAFMDLNTRTIGARYYKDVAVVTDNYYSTSPSSTSMKTTDSRWGEWTDYSTTKPKEYETREIETREKIKYALAREDTWKLIDESELSMENLLSKIKSLNYENINTLEDIDNSVNLKYTWKMQYRKKNN